jgi:hypothetical protein
MENSRVGTSQDEVVIRKQIREIVDKVAERSQDDYEKNLIYITAGTLVLSLTFIEKIAPLKDAIHIWMIVTSWGVLSLSLATNLFSHWFASYAGNRSQYMINDSSKTITQIKNQIYLDNKVVHTLNISTFSTMFLGIIFLVLYCSFNTYHMSNLEDKNRTNDKRDQTDIIQKGRVTPPIFDYSPTTVQEPVHSPQPQTTPPPPSTDSPE